jgi:hypothetical protein
MYAQGPPFGNLLLPLATTSYLMILAVQYCGWDILSTVKRAYKNTCKVYAFKILLAIKTLVRIFRMNLRISNLFLGLLR